MRKLISDVKLYVQLLKSVGVQGSGPNKIRPLQPVECAQYIKRLIDEEGDTLHQVAERLNLGKPKDQSNLYKKRDTAQVTSFLNLLRLSEKSRQLAGWDSDGYPLIPFSTMSQLVTMAPSEQDMIIQSIFTAKDKKKDSWKRRCQNNQKMEKCKSKSTNRRMHRKNSKTKTNDNNYSHNSGGNQENITGIYQFQ